MMTQARDARVLLETRLLHDLCAHNYAQVWISKSIPRLLLPSRAGVLSWLVHATEPL